MAEIGEVFIPGQFISTSVVKGKAFDYPYTFEIYVRKQSNAAYIELLSGYPKQRELLLDKDFMYRVISRKGNTIGLEVV